MDSRLEADPVAELRERLGRYTPEHHPLQHATAQFHLGNVLLARDALDEAEAAFTEAAALFALRGARPEQAKALNGLGATLKAAGRPELAAKALEHAVAGLAAARLVLDEGAARYNHALVLRDLGQHAAAAAELQAAAQRLDPEAVPRHAAAASRELGATQLQLGDAQAAERAFTDAMALADRGGDHPGRAAAANGLGLARLAAGRPAEAADAFAAAAAGSPRALRPEAFAMAKANLALACERLGQSARARLAARQAIGAPGAPQAVQAQAEEVLERLGDSGDDLAVVLAELSAVERERLVREELARTVDRDAGGRLDDLRAWIRVHVTSALDPSDVAELWLGGLLELPATDLERLVHDVQLALRDVDGEPAAAFRHAVGRGMARFHIPQWMRLQDVFERAAEVTGDPGPWR